MMNLAFKFAAVQNKQLISMIQHLLTFNHHVSVVLSKETSRLSQLYKASV